MNKLEYKGYRGSVEYSAEDNCFFGKVLGMNKASITYEGNTLEELTNDFKAGIDSYLEGCKNIGIKPQKAFSGSLNVRIPSETHSKVATIAENNGISINAFVKQAIENAIANR
ncbi:MAG: type II toxin-antitoxin system HicB family antitoxin [Prevotellaceae bacterium]|jgi:predicted HicB family RNase H-like nuclease|nr:type II toxin-antitoxin system HicB family antitoxin [Prevotellaceae bacterium]